jgi:Tfp pilus assembly protein PilV
LSVRAGLGLVELIVALTLFTVALLGLAGVAAVAQSSLADAASIERAADSAAAVIDSLLRVRDPVAGERTTGAARVRWSITHDSTARVIVTHVTVERGNAMRTYDFTTVHGARPR